MVINQTKVVKNVVNYVDEGFLCVEAVLKALADAKGTKSDFIPAIGTGMGAGVARTGQICGAVTGAILGLGLWFGRNEPTPSVRRPYWFSRLFIDSWVKDHSNTSCSGLLEIDLDDPEDLVIFLEENYWETKCKRYIMNAVELAISIINENSSHHMRACNKK